MILIKSNNIQLLWLDIYKCTFICIDKLFVLLVDKSVNLLSSINYLFIIIVTIIILICEVLSLDSYKCIIMQ